MPKLVRKKKSLQGAYVVKKTKADRTRLPRSAAHYLRLLIAPAMLGLSAITPAHAQQVLNLVPGEQVYPWVEQGPSAAGGQSIRKLKTTKTSSGKEVVADRVLIQLQKGLAAAEQLQIHQQAASLGAGAAKSVLQLPNGYYLVDVTGASVEAAVQAYRAADSRVLAAGPDSIMKADATTNDPLLADQWHLDRIQAKEAWDRSRAAGIKVAILDTGIDESLPDLAGKVDARWNTVLSSSSNTNDDVGHGTSVAGIVAATANNMIGVAGVGPDVRLLNVKIAVDGIFIPSAAAAGIYWAADHGAHVLNMSFGVTYDCALSHPDVTVLRNALAYASSRNMVLVAAAGNDGITAKTTPASCPNVLSVAATTPNDVVASRSTRGTWVQVAAPGVSVLSTRLPGERDPSVDPCRPLKDDDSYGYCGPASGFTSFAAPIVSGIAALVRASCSQPDLSIHHQTVVNRITSTADAIAGTGTHWKYGRVNAKNAVCIPRPVLTHTATTPTSLSFSWNDRSSESSFEFWHRPFGGSWSSVLLPANRTQHTLGGLQMGAWYETTVRACDALGCSEFATPLVRQVNYFQLTVTRIGGGSIFSLWPHTAIDCGPSCAAVLPAGTQITLRALGGFGWDGEYEFSHWEGACSGTWNDCTVTVNQMLNATAVFFRTSSEPPCEFC